MPGLEDGLFSKSVIYLCEHSPRGALGIIINKPAELKMAALFGKVDLHLQRADLADQAVFQGGRDAPQGDLAFGTSRLR